MEFLEQVPHRIGPFLVGVGLEKRPVGREIADVAIALIAHGAQAEDRLVAAIPRPEDAGAGRLGRGPQKDPPLHPLGLGEARDGQHRGGQIDRLDEARVDRAGFELLGRRKMLWPADHKRNVQPLFVAELLSPDMRLAMVSHEHHHRVVGESCPLQLPQHDAHLVVEFLGRFEIAGHVFAGHRMVGIVGRERHFLRIDRPGRMEDAVRLMEVDLGVERLVLGEVGPLGGLKYLPLHLEVPVGLAGSFESKGLRQVLQERAEVARRREPLRQCFDPVRKPEAVVAVGAMVVGADRGLIHPRHKGRPAGRTDRRRGVGPGVPHPLGCKAVDVWRLHLWAAVAAQGRPKIFGDQPENVRLSGSRHILPAPLLRCVAKPRRQQQDRQQEKARDSRHPWRN